MPLGSRHRAAKSGCVQYTVDVVTQIVELAVSEVKGIAALSGRGVRVELSPKRAAIKTAEVDVFIDVCSRYSCTEVAYLVQEAVKKALETMTEYKIGAINVNVLGAVLVSEEGGEHDESEG